MADKAMVSCGVTVHATAVHRVKRTFHTDRADIDMRHDHDDQHQRHETVPDLVVLLLLKRCQAGRQIKANDVEKGERIGTYMSVF